MPNQQQPNALINETSPYLLQHAYNPVQWYAWNEEALEKAKREDKPILVSIGYSSCHWCHVMERESFENEQIAEVMNQYFVCIKIDREERPDIDQIYMEAIQVMGINGGWPLNVFLMPDTKPFYGGTYFPPQQWENILLQIAKAFQEHRADLEKSANGFAESISSSELARYGLTAAQPTFETEMANQVFQQLAQKFDRVKGGNNRAPKFPMPSIYAFLLRFHLISENELALEHSMLTLDQMAAGGIYDQIGGGFARYSVDAEWFAPHFEKMLYDNAQLLSLYSEAYALTKKDDYREIVEETIAYLVREMRDEAGGFYSALDADSEGVEGKFYTWSVDEIDSLLGDDAELFKDYYSMEAEGNWEHSNILYKNYLDEVFAERNSLTIPQLKRKIESWKTILLQARDSRIRPSLDDKVLTSWNGLLLKGLTDAYQFLGNKMYLVQAIQLAEFLDKKIIVEGKLWHSYKAGKVSIQAYLEDYAAVIQGFIGLYQVTFEEKWLEKAKTLTDYTLTHFFDEKEKMFFFTDNTAEKLIARKKEIFDNVIPSSNSIMATNLHFLGLMLDNENYKKVSENMLAIMAKQLGEWSYDLTNWASLLTYYLQPTYEVIIIGEEAKAFAQEIAKHFIPNKIIMASEKPSVLPLFENREAIGGKTTVYVCQNKTCQLPVHTIEEALNLIQF